jgi:hypothetical protein
MAAFPNSVKSFAIHNAGDTIQQADVNDCQDEIAAIETGYLTGTAQLNSSHSTLATLSVLGGSTLAGNLTLSGGLSIGKAIQPSSIVTLTDGATVALDASLGNVFRLAASGNRTISVPTNASPGQKMIIAHAAVGAGRTLTLTTGSSGAFRFGTDVTGLSATTSGKTDYIGSVYNGTDERWDVLAVVKGY